MEMFIFNFFFFQENLNENIACFINVLSLQLTIYIFPLHTVFYQYFKRLSFTHVTFKVVIIIINRFKENILKYSPL